MMFSLFVLFVFTSTPRSQEFTESDFHLTVSITSSIYTYRLTNTGSDSIVSLDLGQHAAYNFLSLEGWIIETTPSKFKTWAPESHLGIQPNQEGLFSMRISSRGAVLGSAPAMVRFQSGRSVTVSDVWVPVAEPRYYKFIIAGVVLIFVFYQGWIVRRRRISIP
ncbi:MAG: hypothetical protein JXA82_06440 [Sedimentisphaerales bacterium]|nr:hypothetical protein [Sedimentisphaerales bacterium]